jgi:hypothetical protein
VAAVVVGAVVMVGAAVVTGARVVVVSCALVDVATFTRRRGESPPLASAIPSPPNPRMTSTAITRMRTGVSEAGMRCLTHAGS